VVIRILALSLYYAGLNKPISRGPISVRCAICPCRLVCIWSALSSAICPSVRSSQRPPRVTSPAIRMAMFLGPQKWSRHFSVNTLGRSGHDASIRISAKMPPNSIAFPKSLHLRAASRATSKSWFIPNSDWTIEDYKQSDNRIRRAGDVLIILIFIAWIIRLARDAGCFEKWKLQLCRLAGALLLALKRPPVCALQQPPIAFPKMSDS
jgi:hypothetical protein